MQTNMWTELSENTFIMRMGKEEKKLLMSIIITIITSARRHVL